MEAVHAMVHAHYGNKFSSLVIFSAIIIGSDSGPFSYNQCVNYEASGQQREGVPYRSGKGEGSRGAPSTPRGVYSGGVHAAP